MRPTTAREGDTRSTPGGGGRFAGALSKTVLHPAARAADTSASNQFDGSSRDSVRYVFPRAAKYRAGDCPNTRLNIAMKLLGVA